MHKARTDLRKGVEKTLSLIDGSARQGSLHTRIRRHRALLARKEAAVQDERAQIERRKVMLARKEAAAREERERIQAMEARFEKVAAEERERIERFPQLLDSAVGMGAIGLADRADALKKLAAWLQVHGSDAEEGGGATKPAAE